MIAGNNSIMEIFFQDFKFYNDIKTRDTCHTDVKHTDYKVTIFNTRQCKNKLGQALYSKLGRLLMLSLYQTSYKQHSKQENSNWKGSKLDPRHANTHRLTSNSPFSFKTCIFIRSNGDQQQIIPKHSSTILKNKKKRVEFYLLRSRN